MHASQYLCKTLALRASWRPLSTFFVTYLNTRFVHLVKSCKSVATLFLFSLLFLALPGSESITVSLKITVRRMFEQTNRKYYSFYYKFVVYWNSVTLTIGH